MDRELEFELVNNTNGNLIGRVWWDGKKIQADKPKAMGMIKHEVVNGLSFEDGKEYLEAIPHLFKSGYISARKVTS